MAEEEVLKTSQCGFDPHPGHMAETQRQPVPRIDTGELDTALAFLRFARASVAKKLDDLDDEQVRRVLVPTGTTLPGLVHHLTTGERYWFGHHVAGGVAGPGLGLRRGSASWRGDRAGAGGLPGGVRGERPDRRRRP